MFTRSYVEGHEGHPHYFSDKQIKAFHKKYSNGKIDQELLMILKNLSDPTKLSIYLLLQEVEEMPVTDIVHVLDISQSAVSHALSDLKKLNLVESNRCGKLICYSLKKQKKKRSVLLALFEKFRV